MLGWERIATIDGQTFDRAMAIFAETYADQNDRDYRALHDAAASGRVAAELIFPRVEDAVTAGW
jgi:hypothetical protein